MLQAISIFFLNIERAAVKGIQINVTRSNRKILFTLGVGDKWFRGYMYSYQK